MPLQHCGNPCGSGDRLAMDATGSVVRNKDHMACLYTSQQEEHAVVKDRITVHEVMANFGNGVTRLTFRDGFKQQIQRVTLSTLGDCVGRNMENVTTAERLAQLHLWRAPPPEHGERDAAERLGEHRLWR